MPPDQGPHGQAPPEKAGPSDHDADSHPEAYPSEAFKRRPPPKGGGPGEGLFGAGDSTGLNSTMNLALTLAMKRAQQDMSLASWVVGAVQLSNISDFDGMARDWRLGSMK